MEYQCSWVYSVLTGRDSDVRCLGIVGVWCLYCVGGVVSVPVAFIVGECAHYSGGVAADCGGLCRVWGVSRHGKTVQCRCDNVAVVAILKLGKSKHPLVMHLMRCLFFFIAYHQLFLDLVHLPGRLNDAADSLSHDNLPPLFPTASASGTVSPVPPPGHADRGVGAPNA